MTWFRKRCSFWMIFGYGHESYKLKWNAGGTDQNGQTQRRISHVEDICQMPRIRELCSRPMRNFVIIKIMQCRHRLHNTVHNIIVIKIDKVIHDVSFLSCIFYHNFASTLTYWSIPKIGDVLYIVLGPSRYTFDGLNNLLAAAFDFEDHEVFFLFQTLVFQLVFFVVPHRPQEMPLQLCHEVRESVYQILPAFHWYPSRLKTGDEGDSSWFFYCLRYMVPKECVPRTNFGFQLSSAANFATENPGSNVLVFIDDEAGSVLRSPIPVSWAWNWNWIQWSLCKCWSKYILVCQGQQSYLYSQGKETCSMLCVKLEFIQTTLTHDLPFKNHLTDLTWDEMRNHTENCQ